MKFIWTNIFATIDGDFRSVMIEDEIYYHLRILMTAKVFSNVNYIFGAKKLIANAKKVSAIISKSKI